MESDRIRAQVAEYYDAKLAAYGAAARGVDWHDERSQALRFEQLLNVLDDDDQPFSINDYGCGYGALVAELDARHATYSYVGFDFSRAMLEQARRTHAGRVDCVFVEREADLGPADYTVASGILNVKLGFPTELWERYVRETLERLAVLSTRGFAFNALTTYSDAERQRDDLYYADPLVLFDLCKRAYSRNVALLHDYGLYEFTLVVRL